MLEDAVDLTEHKTERKLSIPYLFLILYPGLALNAKINGLTTFEQIQFQSLMQRTFKPSL